MVFFLGYTKPQYNKLVKEAKEHDQRYYLKYSPTVSDYEYDCLLKMIEEIEGLHPDWVEPTSPTRRVSSDRIAKGFKQVKHAQKMLSLANTYSEGELSDFVERVKKLLCSNRQQIHFTAEIKMDGVACAIRYEDGVLVRGVTRGDGLVGDDVTANVGTISNLPKKLTGEDISGVLELRGEVYMPLGTFKKLNAEKSERGEEVYANPRNAAAGSLKLLDSKKAAKRNLSIVIYDMVDGSKEIDSQSEIASHLRKLGLPVFDKSNVKLCKDIKEIIAFANYIESHRSEFSFEIDGVVVKLDSLSERKKIGCTNKSPRWAVAYKFAPESATTIVEGITVQVGRTGVLTPVAELKPVSLAGSTISRATLHNQDEIDRKDLRIGDVVIIEKGGDVIPKVVSVDKSKRGKNSQKWHMPTHCPSCGALVSRNTGEVAYVCRNKSCQSQNLRKISFFVAKGAMNIDHLGEKVISKLIDAGFVSKISDLYRLTEDDLRQIEGFKDKSVANLLDSIEKSKDTTLERFIYALGIKFVGKGAADIIARHVKIIQNFVKITFESLMEMDGIGPKAAEAVVEYLDEDVNVAEMNDLLKLGITCRPVKSSESGHQFNGKVFGLTGTLHEFTRLEAAELIKERGGSVSSSVGNKTDYLLIGDNPGSKLSKSKKLGVTVMSEKEFKSDL